MVVLKCWAMDWKICVHKIIARITVTLDDNNFLCKYVVLTKIIFAQKITDKFDIFGNSFNFYYFF